MMGFSTQDNSYHAVGWQGMADMLTNLYIISMNPPSDNQSPGSMAVETSLTLPRLTSDTDAQLESRSNEAPKEDEHGHS